MQAEQLTGPEARHAEGPVWSSSWGGLRWVDMLAGDVLSLADDGRIMRRHVGRVAAAVRPRVSGGAVIAVERGFVLEAADGTLTRQPDLWDAPGIRMNEGGCDPDGRFYCGSMADDQRPGAGTLYRLDADGQVHTALSGLTIPNGLEWSPDGCSAYHADSAAGTVTAYAYDRERGFVAPHVFSRIPTEQGVPDGLTVDAAGGVWVALHGGGAVHRYAPSGRLDEVIELPVVNVTACTFGGPDLAQLFITTSREGTAAGAEPAAGSLFTCVPGATGRPVRPFGG